MADVWSADGNVRGRIVHQPFPISISYQYHNPLQEKKLT